MQLVINIPEELYEANIRGLEAGEVWDLRVAVKNGTPLKGHGRLGDLDKIYVELNEAQIEGTEEYKGLGKAKQIICDAKTIIEADKSPLRYSALRGIIKTS